MAENTNAIAAASAATIKQAKIEQMEAVISKLQDDLSSLRSEKHDDRSRASIAGAPKGQAKKTSVSCGNCQGLSENLWGLMGELEQLQRQAGSARMREDYLIGELNVLRHKLAVCDRGYKIKGGANGESHETQVLQIELSATRARLAEKTAHLILSEKNLKKTRYGYSRRLQKMQKYKSQAEMYQNRIGDLERECSLLEEAHAEAVKGIQNGAGDKSPSMEDDYEMVG
ncbi:hypothetical protein M426DRAFT_316353 [Hypoxylon sp. CI-4A]|nr:hypothetical protein M426DRAFT_316353 [Hypoxylon sp. CI-4A]